MGNNQSNPVPGSTGQGRIVVEDQTHRLLRHYILAAWITLIVFVVVSGLIYRKLAVNNLVQEAEDQNIIVARQFANTSWPEFTSFVSDTSGLSGDDLRDYSESSGLREALLIPAGGLPVVRIRLYARDGLIAFSTDDAEMGSYATDEAIMDIVNWRWYRDDPGVVTQLTHHDVFEGLDSTIRDCDLVSSAVAIPGDGRRTEVVLQVTQNITPGIQKIARAQMIGIGSGVLIATVLWVFVNGYIRRRQAPGLEDEV